MVREVLRSSSIADSMYMHLTDAHCHANFSMFADGDGLAVGCAHAWMLVLAEIGRDCALLTRLK
ncbi:MAG: hypothetical protein ACLUKN_02790 [Bacilli bacterium]